MKRSPARGLAALALGALLFVAGCGGDKEARDASTAQAVPVAANAPGFCSQVATLPSDLNAAVASAAGGTASDAEKATIARGATQLRNAAGDASVPTDVRTTLTDAAGLLDKLASGTALDAAQATSFSTTFQNLQKVVSNTCSAG